jgi:acyl-CoA thioester hydrolase
VIHFTQAVVHLMAALGLPRATLLRRKVGYASLDHAVEYRAALKPGDRVDMRSGVLEIRPKVLRIFHHVINVDSEEIATAIEIALVFFDLSARKSIPMPEEVIEHARTLMANGPNHATHDSHAR